jgi:hypothetical protein
MGGGETFIAICIGDQRRRCAMFLNGVRGRTREFSPHGNTRFVAPLTASALQPTRPTPVKRAIATHATNQNNTLHRI